MKKIGSEAFTNTSEYLKIKCEVPQKPAGWAEDWHTRNAKLNGEQKTRPKKKEQKMVKHIILWTLKPELSDAEKENIKKEIKTGLENLKGKIPGLVEIKVITEGRLASSTTDLMLDSTFENEDALKTYSKHPEHVAIADGKVRPFAVSRACLDFEV